MIRFVPIAFVSICAALLLVACSDDESDPEQTPPAETEAAGTTAARGSLATTTPAPEATNSPTPETASVSCPEGAETGLTIVDTEVDGVERSYRLYVPASYDASEPLPLVLNFHGLASSAEEQEYMSGLADVAEENEFVLVSPDGTGFPRRWYIYGDDYFWDADDAVDDFAFVDALIDEVSAAVCIDPERIFATGISNGGGMAALAACESDRIAAIAPVAGAPYAPERCDSDRPVPVIAFAGTGDFLIPIGDDRDWLPIATVRETLADWGERNGCDLTLQTERVAEDVVLESYEDCDNDADVQLYVVEDGGHTWPGYPDDDYWYLGRTTRSIDASELIWTFFEDHSE